MSASELSVSERLRESLHAIIGNRSDLVFQPVYGGCISQSYCVKAGSQKFFLKTTLKSMPDDFFEKEASGLSLLRDQGLKEIPEVIYTGRNFLILEWIEQARTNLTAMMRAGRALAILHRKPQAFFGLDADNYIGSLPQKNGRFVSWSECYFHSKIWPAAQEAFRRGHLQSSVLSYLEQLYKKLPELLPDESPSLLHGDLWAGNLMSDSDGRPYFIDPAVYFGHREMDIAMSFLFGGFTASFYDSYNDVYPLLPDFKARLPLYKIYPLLVHAALFGNSYQTECLDCIRIYL